MRVTLADLQASRIPAALGLCPTDPRIIAWCNEAQERLLYEGKWFGTVATFNICATNGYITLPREIATIEAINTCGHPTPVRDFWYEFLANGFGTRHEKTGTNEAVQRGRYPTFGDIGATPSQITFICDVATDSGKTVLVLGYDLNNNWIRTIQNGAYADGEVITLAQSSGGTSVSYFSTITDIQFLQPMDGQSWLYVIDNAAVPTGGSVLHGNGSPVTLGISPSGGLLYINDLDGTIWAVVAGVWHQEV